MKHKKFVAGFFSGVFFTMVSAAIYAVININRLHEGCGQCRVAVMAIENIGFALSLYAKEEGGYPSEMEGISALHDRYLVELPIEPWGNSFQYAIYNSGGAKCFLVWSLGSDGVSGGVNKDEQDIFVNHKSGNCLTKSSN